VAAITEGAEEAKRKILAIGAQSGDAGIKAYQDARAAITASTDAALAQAHGYTANIDASHANSTIDALIGRPALTAQQGLDAGEAGFRATMEANRAGALTYLDKLAALEPALLAQAAAAGGGGGGGGGGGSGAKEKQLSDSELRVRLTGAAQLDKADRVAAAVQAAQGSRAELRGVRKDQRQNRQQRRKVRRRVDLEPEKDAKRLTPAQALRLAAHPQRLYAMQRRGVTDARLMGMGLDLSGTPRDFRQQVRRVGRLHTLRDEAATLRGERRDLTRTARQDYADQVGASQASLADLARQIGVDSGLDPEQAVGLFTPTQEKSLGEAERALAKEQGGVIGRFGAPARGSAAIAAKALKITPKAVQQLRASKQYEMFRTALEQTLAQGHTIDEWITAMQTDERWGAKKRLPMTNSLLSLLSFEFAPAG
jgi:hypothetical protein